MTRAEQRRSERERRQAEHPKDERDRRNPWPRKNAKEGAEE